jgi:hypothetical protein
MLLHGRYLRRVIAIERWPRRVVAGVSLVAGTGAGALAWIYRAAIAAGTADRIVMLVVAAVAVALAVPVRWAIARVLDGEGP